MTIFTYNNQTFCVADIQLTDDWAIVLWADKTVYIPRASYDALDKVTS